MIPTGSVFSRPSTPAAKCLHVIRLREVTSRSELVEATGLSQPTITRAVAALVVAGYVTERTDLIRARGRGRPTIPLTLGSPRAIHAGIAVGTTSTYVALFNLRGQALRSMDIDIAVARLSEDDFIQHIMAGLNRLRAGLDRPLATIGVTTSGTVSSNGEVYAPNLNWHGVNIGAHMREQFGVPVSVTSAAAAIVGSEAQSRDTLGGPGIMALFADDSIACAVGSGDEVVPVPVSREDLTTDGLIRAIGIPSIRTLSDALTSAHRATTRPALTRRARQLGELTAQLYEQHTPDTVVVAGSAFIDDPLAPAPFARAVRNGTPAGTRVSLRMIPTHREVVRDIARAVALDLVLREPLAVSSR
ncbi:ROK family transcriptional regulator [Corynebacterium timonense]|uniref:ROK family protein n=1 Tax=Corynebacterium timonense TaxID=441500 RepID=A0A1H1TYV6_9CORY|nr:ROK family transcriptional regulator [Corynebacterium timonense]SDS65410.1 ROK family protein [Corynebacterium timonense]